jgi:chlorobactene glucosyltransferase
MTYVFVGLLVAWTVLTAQTLVNLAVFRPLRPADPPGPRRAWPTVSIVIPARNEERSIGATIDAALAQDYPSFEVVCVDDESVDGTAAEITARATDRRLVALSCPPLPEGWLGKPHALAQGASRAKGEWLLFMDADVRLASSTIRQTVGRCEAEGWDHLTLLAHFERGGFWEEVAMPLLPVFFFVFSPSYLALFRSHELAFGGGAFNLVRRRAYDAIGGHRRIASSVVDDIRLAMELKAAGFHPRTRLAMSLVRLRMYHGLREIIEGFTKNAHAVWADREASMLGVSLVLFAVNLLPFLWIALFFLDTKASFLPPQLWLGVSLALLLLCRALVQVRQGFALWSVPFHPLAILVGLAITVRSLHMAYGQGVVRWRGREYRRRDTSF